MVNIVCGISYTHCTVYFYVSVWFCINKMYLPGSPSRKWVYSERIGRHLWASLRTRGTKNRKYFQKHLQNDLNLAGIPATRQRKPYCLWPSCENFAALPCTLCCWQSWAIACDPQSAHRSTAAEFLVPDWGYIVILWHRVVVPAHQAYIGWRAGTTTLCQSQLYPTVRD